MSKLKLNFMVDPKYLAKECRVPNKVKILITHPHDEALKPYLGESGRKMAEAGAPFYFERKIAKILVNWGVAIRLDK